MMVALPIGLFPRKRPIMDGGFIHVKKAPHVTRHLDEYFRKAKPKSLWKKKK